MASVNAGGQQVVGFAGSGKMQNQPQSQRSSSETTKAIECYLLDSDVKRFSPFFVINEHKRLLNCLDSKALIVGIFLDMLKACVLIKLALHVLCPNLECDKAFTVLLFS